jgi:hypothetical protein
MGFRFDTSSCTVLAVCDQCDWMELTLDADLARTLALDHVLRVHPAEAQTANSLYQWRRRRAAGGGN